MNIPSHFTSANYPQAETSYTSAIQQNPSLPNLFTNRAITRLRLSPPTPDLALDDALHALSLDPNHLKAHYYLAQAQLALNHPNEAHASALKAYERARETNDRSLTACGALVLSAKKARWEAQERGRWRGRGGLLDECVEGIEARAEKELEEIEREGEGEEGGEGDGDKMTQTQVKEARDAIVSERDRKVEELRTVFAIADPKNVPGKRHVPDWMIDPVTFSVMHDPVTTKNGISYERATILEHLKRNARDPLTGEPMGVGDLRPNLGLRSACEEFLGENGWAVDW